MSKVELQQTIGIIAGNGRFPLVSLRNAKKKNFRVVVCGVKGEAMQEVVDEADVALLLKLGQLKRLANFLSTNGVTRAIMAGKITKTNLFKGEVLPDLDMIQLMAKTFDSKDDTLLSAIAGYLEERGIILEDSTQFLDDQMVPECVLTKKQPTEDQAEDMLFGWRLAKEMGRLDVGQSVVVKKKAIMSVEAIEGTDECILRGGELGGKETVVVKVSKPNQDMRFDVPTVGLNTLDAMVKSKASVLALEAGKTILLDPEAFVKKADDLNLVVCGVNYASSL